MAGESARESARRQREKAERLTRAAERYERGAMGEEVTARALAMLPAAEWTVLNDLRWPGRKFANVDHVVIGPPGVFVIDSKNWSGRLSVRDDVLRCNGYRKEREVAGAAEAALAVHGLVPGLRPDLVYPALCFVRDENIGGRSRDVLLCSTSNVVEMLLSRHPRLTAQQVQEVSLQLDMLLHPATGPAATPPLRSGVQSPARRPRVLAKLVRPTSQPVAQAARRRKARNSEPSIARLLVALVIVGVLIFAPGVATGIGTALAQLLTAQ